MIKTTRIQRDNIIEYLMDDGRRHREDGPAYHTINNINGYQRWYVEGKEHREDGPAVISPDAKYWYFHGKLHRLGGPAIEYSNGRTAWYFEGREFATKTEYFKFLGKEHLISLE